MYKIIPNTNDCYSCDEFGNIKSNDRWIYNQGSNKTYFLEGKILSPYINNKGYLMVDLRINNKTVRCLVHRLVAITFIPNPNNYPIINHKNNNPLDCSVDNLEWCTYSYNIEYAINQNRMNYTSENRIKWQKSKKNIFI